MMRKGIVVEVHPEDHSVDIVMADNGDRLVGVQVMTPNGSTRSGTVDLPEIPKRKDKWDISSQTGQDMHAVVSYVGGQMPVVTGFLYPQVNQMTNKDPKLRIDRHQSDVMSMIDGDGNFQWTHPSGTYVRVGEQPDSVDMTDKNADASTKVDRNTDRKVHVRIGLAGGNAVLTITPDGAVTLTTKQTVDIEALGAAKVKAESVTLETANTHLTGSLTVDGETSLQGVKSRGHDISNTHRHNNSGGPGVGGTPV